MRAVAILLLCQALVSFNLTVRRVHFRDADVCRRTSHCRWQHRIVPTNLPAGPTHRTSSTSVPMSPIRLPPVLDYIGEGSNNNRLLSHLKNDITSLKPQIARTLLRQLAREA